MESLKLTKLVNRVSLCGEVLSTETILINNLARIKFTLLTTFDKNQRNRRTVRCLLTEPSRRTATKLFKGSFVFITDGYLQTYRDDTYIVLCKDVAVFYLGFSDKEMTESEITEFLTKNGLQSILDRIDLDEFDMEE